MTEKKMQFQPTTQEEKNIAAHEANTKTGLAETAAGVAQNAKIAAARGEDKIAAVHGEENKTGDTRAEEDKAGAAPVNKWKCHKVVTARKILAIDPIMVEDEKGNKHKVDDMPPTAFTDGRPSVGDYILLDDGPSVSWKTAKEFERDYARVDENKTERIPRVITDPAEAKRLGVKVGDPYPAESHRWT